MDDDFDPTACKNCGSPLDEDEREVCGPCYAEEMSQLAADEAAAEEVYREMCEANARGDYPESPIDPNDPAVPF